MREATLTLDRLRETLTAVLDRALPACAHFEWRLVGTGAALLHGVALPAADVDILARRREAVDAFAAALRDFPCLEPARWLPEARQYYANFEVNGVEVGISTVEWDAEADGLECVGPGPWAHYALLRCGPHAVPTVALELRLVSEVIRARPDRAEPILACLRERGCDLELVRQGLQARGLPETRQADVVRRLGKEERIDP
jgi:hypothetical protein